MKFPPDLVARVRYAVARSGFCILSRDEINRVLAVAPANLRARHEAMERFAQICGANMETTEHLTSARFVPSAAGAAAEPHPLHFLLAAALGT
jgi:hypothetical protein